MVTCWLVILVQDPYVAMRIELMTIRRIEKGKSILQGETKRCVCDTLDKSINNGANKIMDIIVIICLIRC